MAIIAFGGGINEQDIGLVDAQECISGYNFELEYKQSRFRPRNPFDLKGTATNAGNINGFIQLIKNDNTETTLVQSDDTVYEWDGASTFTSRGTVNTGSRLRGVTWSLGGYSVITDLAKLTVVKKWDGATFSTMTTGLGVDLYAKFVVVYLGRVWLFNVKAGTDTPHLCVASAYENPESYDTTKRAQDSSFSTGNEAFYMTTPDLLPINGVVLFFNTLIVSTENGRLWKLTGVDSTDFAWTPFYSGSSAAGTGVNVEAMINIGNDIAYMKSDGIIESLAASDTYGDVNADDLSRWIPDTVEGLSSCITAYDQARQKVYFFAGSNKVLVLFKDLLATDLSPWSLYKTNHTSSFSTRAAIYMRQPGGSNYYVYWGDSSGRIFQMDGTGTGDPSSTNIDSNRKSKFIEMFEDKYGNPVIPEYMTVRGRVFYRRVADADLLMDFEWADDYAINRCTVPLDGPSTGDGAIYWGGSGYWGGLFYWNVGFQFSQRVSTKGFSPVGRGPGFHVSTTLQTTQVFDILKLEI